MQMYFARHAQSQNNALERQEDYLTSRYEDPAITAVGWKQAEALASVLAGQTADAQPLSSYRNPWNHLGFDLTHIYCSLQRRSVETARVVAEKTGLPVTGWSPIHETGGVIRYDTELKQFRGVPGADHAALRTWNPQIVLGEDAHPAGWWQSREMESDEQVRMRAKSVFQTVLEWHGKTNDRVLLVSHGTFYNYLLCEILGIELRNELWFPLHNCGLTRIDIADGEDFEPGMDAAWKPLGGLPVRVAYVNRLDHVPAELIT